MTRLVPLALVLPLLCLATPAIALADDVKDALDEALRANRAGDVDRSLAWYQKAADQGGMKALCAMGNQYMRGLGVLRDPARAVALCRQAAELGDPDAQTDLGLYYLVGNGVPRSTREALHWLTQAAAQGQPNAAFNLGIMHWNGDGTARDREAAADWLEVAARNGNPSAPKLLGDHWLTIAAANAEQRQLDEQAALTTLYWYAIASEADPDPAARADATSKMEALLALAPHLGPKLDYLLGTEGR